MANTYTQIYLQMVFVVQNRASVIKPEWEDELQKYITGVVRNCNHKMIIVNGVQDHQHLLIGLHPNQSVSDLARAVKSESSEWINKRKFVPGRFSWQEGFGAFSYSRDQIDHVYKYIKNQKNAHVTKSFRDEYMDLLKEFGVEYDQRYIFKKVE